MDGGAHGGEQGLGRACCDGDFAVGINVQTVYPFEFGADLFAQHRHTCHRRVLVVPKLEVMADGVGQHRVNGVIGKALRQIDGLVFHCQGRHHRKNGGAVVG